MGCRITVTACKTAGEAKPQGFNYTDFLTNRWESGTIYAAGERIRPLTATGFQYSSSGGQSASEEPSWPTTLGGTVTDGSITWTAQAITNDSLRATISSSAWAASSSDITIAGETSVNTGGSQVVTALISGGTAGRRYEITNTVTLSDSSIEQSVLRLRISA
jgi:hypothetical protein